MKDRHGNNVNTREAILAEFEINRYGGRSKSAQDIQFLLREHRRMDISLSAVRYHLWNMVDEGIMRTYAGSPWDTGTNRRRHFELLKVGVS